MSSGKLIGLSIVALSWHTALAAPVATLLSDQRGGSVDIMRTLRDPNTLNTQSFDDPNSSSVNTGEQQGGGPGGVKQVNKSPDDDTILESIFTNSDYVPSSPGIGGQFNEFTANVIQSVDMTSSGYEAGDQLHLVGNLSLNATEQFSITTATPWSWKGNFTLTNNNDPISGLYQFSLKNSSNVTLASDASDTLDGTDHISFGTLVPGTYTMTFSLTTGQAYGYTQAGETHSTISGKAVFALPEPGMTALLGVGFAMIATRRRGR